MCCFFSKLSVLRLEFTTPEDYLRGLPPVVAFFVIAMIIFLKATFSSFLILTNSFASF